MSVQNWKKEIFTVPNLLTLLRLLMLPLYSRIYLNASTSKQFFTAGAIMAVSCLTDLADGIIARHFHQVTNLGKILDPLADKITQFIFLLCLSLRYPVMKPVLALFIVKELFQLVVGIFFLSRGKMLDGALMAGKLCTTVLFISLIALVVLQNPDPKIVSVIAVSNGIFLIVSFLCYFLAYFGRESRLQNPEN